MRDIPDFEFEKREPGEAWTMTITEVKCLAKMSGALLGLSQLRFFFSARATHGATVSGTVKALRIGGQCRRRIRCRRRTRRQKLPTSCCRTSRATIAPRKSRPAINKCGSMVPGLLAILESGVALKADQNASYDFSLQPGTVCSGMRFRFIKRISSGRGGQGQGHHFHEMFYLSWIPNAHGNGEA